MMLIMIAHLGEAQLRAVGKMGKRKKGKNGQI